jgi:hypothetical protein
VIERQTNSKLRSIEVEYWVVDEDGCLSQPGSLVEATEGAEREFVKPLIEVKTTPCETTEELRDELFGRIRKVLRKADDLDKRLVPLATPVNCGEVREIPSERTRIQNVVVGESFRYVRYCAGTHVHVEQQPGHVADQLNAFIALDPALALVSSSPYFDGERLAASARSELYRWMAYDDVPHQGRLWPYVDNTDEWRRRLERRYEEFTRAAAQEGIDRRTVEANFDPESSVWTPVQIRDEFGTVEWRSPDTALPSQAVRLADRLSKVSESVVESDVRIEGEKGRLTDCEVVLPEFDAVLGYLRDAVREGLGSDDVRSYLERMGFDVDGYGPMTEEIGEHGVVTREKARRIRLEYADRLERDVRQLGNLTAE